MPQVRWYFDFISPFAYLQHEVLLRERPELRRAYRPVLFAGLLKHWGGKGPAEIPAKRAVTYRHCQWLAEHHRIGMKFPPAHPFNPLPALRLAVALRCEPACVTRLFRAIYADGADLSQAADWDEVCRQLGVADAAGRIARPWVKEQLRANTDVAAAAGVFGVPSLAVGGHLFWGLDMTGMAFEYLQNPGRFSEGEYRRLAHLPVGQARHV
ncbi:MAG: 2-hydroxychromene-2-carboxylate isomerase [Gammaproteobacteria bacterium]|nr:2-hydroxychromene-2-carboxylate isomerase [Gammaproteobacteria bacterium]